MKIEKHNWIEKTVPFMLIFLSVSMGLVFIYVANQRQLTQLETVLLQSFSLIAGLCGSYIFGKRSAKSSAKELIKPHARSAFRRLMSLYKSLSRLVNAIEQGKQNENEVQCLSVLDKMQAIVIEQISTADDALEDWRDIVPEEVNQLEKKIESLRK